jgi:hypothetical protein
VKLLHEQLQQVKASISGYPKSLSDQHLIKAAYNNGTQCAATRLGPRLRSAAGARLAVTQTEAAGHWLA